MTIPLYDRLDGQVALVTGASRGIGAEIAKGLRELGVMVFGTAREPAPAETPGLTMLALELTHPASITSVIATVRERAGRLDILVNNAGVIGKGGRFGEKVGADDIAEVIEANLMGTIRVTEQALPLLGEAQQPRIVNVTSGAGSFGEEMMPSHLPYCMSKAALNAFTFLLHEQWHDRGLIVNSVCPGWVRTDMGGRDAERSVEKGAETPVWLARFAKGAPSGRFWRDKEEIPW